MNARAFVITVEVEPEEEDLMLDMIQSALENYGVPVVTVNPWNSPGEAVNPLAQIISQMG